MPSRSPLRSDPSARLLPLAFAAVVGSFVATNVLVQRSSEDISDLSATILQNAAPSIEHLAHVRRSVLETELALSRFIHEPQQRTALGTALQEGLTRLKASTELYRLQPAFEGEHEIKVDVQASWDRFDEEIRDARQVAETDTVDQAETRFRTRVEPSARKLLNAATRAIEFNAVHGRELAAQIHSVRDRSVLLRQVLTTFCVLLAVVVAWLMQRQARARRVLIDAHTAALETRAAELEQFAGRVAHDIRNPLTSAKIASDLALRKTSEEGVRQHLTRISRSLSRADEITTALLDFARSGGSPDPGARTDPRPVIADLGSSFGAEAERLNIALECEPVAPALVACSTGVYLSLVGNLVRNAIKYMGDASTRRIRVTVTETNAHVRTEVTDTGPGIAPDVLASLFNPYFRGPSRGVEGLGIGLATVKKLVESHHGRVGVQSKVGEGSTFWFELPRAGTVSWDAPDAPAMTTH